MSTNEITITARRIKKLKIKAEELNKEITELENQIKAAMGDDEEMIAGEFKIRYTFVSSVRFDSSAFKKAAPEMYDRFTKTTQSRRFQIA